MSALDLPPGLGLEGTPLATFVAPARSRRLTTIALMAVVVLLAATWYFASRHWYRRETSTQVVLPTAFLLIALLAFALRRAKLAVTRDGVRWGWTSLAFTQPRERFINVHIYTDGITLEIQRGARWFLSARDWERFEVLVRQLRRVELPTRDYARKAPLRQRLQSYGRFLDGLTVACMVGAFVVAIWAA